MALQGTELRLRPITHLEGQPTLPPAVRVDAAAEGKRRIRPVLTAAHMTQMVLPQVGGGSRQWGCAWRGSK